MHKEHITTLEKSTTSTENPIACDDGVFYIERNDKGVGGKSGNGFLLRRCADQQWPAYECVGYFDRILIGKWQSWIEAPYCPERDSDRIPLGIFKSQAEAIDALWKRRHDALFQRK